MTLFVLYDLYDPEDNPEFEEEPDNLPGDWRWGAHGAGTQGYMRETQFIGALELQETARAMLTEHFNNLCLENCIADFEILDF